MITARRRATIVRVLFVTTLIASLLTPVTGLQASHTPDPSSVTIFGSLQNELGCSGDWQPDCADTHLTYDAEDGVWQEVFNVPAGSWEYKAALNDSLTENYGAGGVQGGPNIVLNLGAVTDVKFYYDHETHWVTDNVNSTIATVAGDFQSELGCSGDWQPWCLQSWMQDPDGDGVHEFSTDAIPDGSYAFKVALDEAWDTSFPGSNVPFTSATGDSVTITYDTATNDVAVTVTPAGPTGPTSVTIAGSLQDELGCPGDWQPDCAATDLGYDAGDDVWQGTFALPGGSYEYKAAIDDSWDENYGGNAELNGANIALNLSETTDVKFYFDHQTHWVADNVNSVIATAAGSFQAGLGCSGDWQPGCLQSWMQDPDGDGIYEFVTDAIPPGAYEFKVALSEAWDISYPASNVAFTVNIGNVVTFTYDSGTNDVTVDPGDPTIEPGDELLVRAPVRTLAQNNVFYFVMPDRFDNGDPSNDTGGDLSGDPLVNGLLPTDKGYYHGGDLAGLTARLPYVDSLGVTAIWLTPQFTNRWVQGDGTIGGSSSGYHGYWQIDYSSIDPHFGTNAEMQAFVAAAHALGIDVFFDIVANHTGDVITYEEGVFTYRNKADYPFRDADGNLFDDRDFVGTSDFPPLDAAISFPYTPTFDIVEDQSVKSPAWLNDPIYYHNRGNSTFTGENSLYGDFFGLDDLFTEHPTVQNGLIQVFKDMVTDFDIDGLRVDTVKHVNDEFWEAFGPELEEYAASLGKIDFFMFGEVFDYDPEFLSRFTTDLPLDAVLDFAFQGTARNFAGQSGSTDNVANFYAADDYYTDADSNAYSLPLFLGNHDIGRVGLFMIQDNPGATDVEMVARDELAHALMYFGRGMPVVYYGDEQGFVGDGGDQDARQDMMPSVVASYNDDDLIGTAATTAASNFDDTHPLYQTFSDYSALLAAHPALTQGAQLHRYSEPSAGIYAFSRIERTEQVEYIVALNNSEAADTATFNTDSPSTTFTELWPGGGPAITSDAAGNLTVDVPTLSVRVFRADAPIPSRAVGIHVSLATPGEGEEVLGRVEVGASLAEARFAEVTFAVSVDGGSFQPIGTDDNAPYRVFYNVADLAPGTPLEFKAIVDDLSGNLSSDKSTAVVGEEEPPLPSIPYAIIHYNRSDGDYGDHTTGDFNDYWGLHLWGDIEETTEWTAPKPFLGEDEYGRFAWVKLAPNAENVGFIVHRGDTKDGTTADRFFNPAVTPEIWLKNDNANAYSSQAEAQGYVTIRYHRDDGDYGTPSPDFNTYWGLHLWGDAIAPSEGTPWTSPKAPDGIDDFGAFWTIDIVDSSRPVNFIIHRGDNKDPGPDESFIPADIPTVWKQSLDETIYPSRGAAEDFATIHYHRPAGDYGDNTSPDFNDFWGLHVWAGALNPNPSWQDPLGWERLDTFGPAFRVDLVDEAPELAYILHRGDTKDPGPDQFLVFSEWGYEVWQLQNADPEHPYLLPLVANRPPVADPNGPYTADEGAPISLDGTGSSDPDSDPLSYSWSVDSGLCTFDDATSPTPDLTCTDNGSFTVTLVAEDGFGASNSDTAPVTVNNVAPTVSVDSLGATEPTILPGIPVELTGSFTDVDADTHTAEIDWGDSTIDSLGTVEQPSGVTGTHTYQAPGVYTVTFRVTDDDGDTGTDSRLVEVLGPVEATGNVISDIDDLLMSATDPAVIDALQEVRDALDGNNEGAANNGAIDKLVSDDLEAALVKIEAAIEALEEAESAGAGDLSALKTHLTLIAQWVAQSAYEDAVAATDPPSKGEQKQLNRIQQALDDGHVLLTADEYLAALDKFQEAVKRSLALS
jgi:glycosidase